jgi:hypothetical protein
VRVAGGPAHLRAVSNYAKQGSNQKVVKLGSCGRVRNGNSLNANLPGSLATAAANLYGGASGLHYHDMASSPDSFSFPSDIACLFPRGQVQCMFASAVHHVRPVIYIHTSLSWGILLRDFTAVSTWASPLRRLFWSAFTHYSTCK